MRLILVMVILMAGLLPVEAQFNLDARTKSILDLYYLGKGSGTIHTNNIGSDVWARIYSVSNASLSTNTYLHRAVAGSNITSRISTNGHEVVTILDVESGTNVQVTASGISGIWGIAQNGTISLLNIFLARRSGYWQVATNGIVTVADISQADAIWTTNGTGRIILRTL